MRVRRWFAVVAVIAGLVLGACTEEGRDALEDAVGDVTVPEGSTPATEAPPETEPPPPATEAPPSTEAPAPAPEEDADDGLSTEEWIVIILLIVVVFGVVLLIGGFASNRQARRDAEQDATRRSLGELVGAARFVHDRAVVDVMRVGDPTQLPSVWAGTRQRMLDVEARASSVAGWFKDPAVAQGAAAVGQQVAALRGALDAHVSARLDTSAPGHDELVGQTAQTVYQRRQELGQAINALATPR